MNENKTNTTTTENTAAEYKNLAEQTTAELYETADRVRYQSLRVRSHSGAPLFRQLMNAAHADQKHRRFNEIAQEISENENAAEYHRKAAAQYASRAKRKTITTAERRAAKAAQREHTAAADKYTSHAAQLYRVIGTLSASDGEDITQEVIARALEIIAEQNEQREDDESGNEWGELHRAAARGIAATAAPDVMTSTKTVVEWMTAERAAALIARYCYDVTAEQRAHINESGKGGKATYWTIEERDRKEERAKMSAAQLAKMAFHPISKKPLCLVRHYFTAAPYISYEEFTTADSAPQIATNGGINAIIDQGDAESVAAIIDRAKLTDRERVIVLKLTDSTARKHATAAYNEVMSAASIKTNTDRKRAESRANSAYTAALWRSALERVGVYSAEAQRKTKSRLVKALTAARAAAEQQTTEEREESRRRHWESAQRRHDEIRLDNSAPRYDVSSRVCSAAYPNLSANSRRKRVQNTTTAAPVIQWTERKERTATEYTPHTMTAEEREERARAAERIEYRRTIRTAAEYNTAAAAALVFWEHMSEDEQTATARTHSARARAAQRRDSLHREGYRAEVYGLNTTLEMWRAWSDDERNEHRRFLDELRKSH